MPAQAFQAAGITARAAQAGKDAASPNADVLLDVVILVDESGSQTAASVAQESQAATTIGQTLLNPASRVTVVGFGGRNGVTLDQDPVNVACQPTIASAADMNYLGTCVNGVNGLHRRTEAEGDDTDYAAALSQAMSYFSPAASVSPPSPPGATKVILFMTDGGLDVHRDPHYLPDWMVKAKAAVSEQVQAARQFGVQIWPLGFGSISDSDHQYLSQISAGGAQTSCNSGQGSKPHAIVVGSAAAAPAAMAQLYAAASCEVVTVDPPHAVGGGRSLYVSIPGIASDAAISVDTGGPGVQVSYYTPAGRQVTGIQLGGSTFQRNQQPDTDVLRITDPQQGRWRIALTASPGHSGQLVSAFAFWQGAVRDLITASPPSAQASEPITVTVSVLSTTGVVTDPATVAALHVTASVSGDGVGPIAIRLSPAGHGAPLAEYTGTFKAPATQGMLIFTGTATAYDLFATVQPAQVQVSQEPGLFYGTVNFNAPGSVYRGKSLPGVVSFNNKTGRAQTVRLLLSATPAGARIVSPVGVVRVPPGPSTTPFTVAFPADTPLGTAFLRVQVVDAAHPQTSYASAPLTIPVKVPPGILAQFYLAFVAAALLVIAILLLAEGRRRKHKNDIDVRGLSAVLTHDDNPAGLPLRAPNPKWSDTFHFVIHDEAGPEARLAMPESEGDDPVYIASRSRNGQVRVVPPAGKKFTVTANGPGRKLPNGLLLSFEDARIRATPSRFRRRPAPVPVTETGPLADEHKPDDLL